MKKLQARLKAAKAELKIRRKAYNSAARALTRVTTQIKTLETALERQNASER